MSRTVGARELKTRLGTYLRQVERGAELVITDRGRPEAELVPLRGGADESERARLRELVALGVLAGGSGRPLTPFQPVPVRGRPVSETLLEDREERFQTPFPPT